MIPLQLRAAAELELRRRKASQITSGNTDYLAQIRGLTRLRVPHAEQQRFIESPAKRKIIRAGRRGGKTVGVGYLAVDAFLKGIRVLYATPTSEQIDAFWFEVTLALAEPIHRKLLYKNETEHVIELPGTKTRIRGKTAWNADSMRGDYGGLLIFDEFQLMDETAWSVVGAPMLLDTDGDAVFIYTPPSMRSRSVTKARDPLHASKMYKAHEHDTTGRWEVFHFASSANPHLSANALDEITQDMKSSDIQREIDALDVDEIPGALWRRDWFDRDGFRLREAPQLTRVTVGVDPSGTTRGDEIGIIVGGVDAQRRGYILADRSLHGTPDEWAGAVLRAYDDFEADLIAAEVNFGGDMVESTLRAKRKDFKFKALHASRGKAVRADPVSVKYEKALVCHVGRFDQLEDEYCTWAPGDTVSPNRLDAAVWTLTDLMLDPPAKAQVQANPFY